MKTVTIVGARPQFIKAAPLSRELRKNHEELLVHTGQHYDDNMSDVFFRELGIPKPDVHLGVGSGSHGEQTAAMLCGIERILQQHIPDVLIVYGDTNSTVAGALAAAKLGISVAHIEAGLRSFNRAMPEEINRVVADHVSRLLFVPSESAAEQLKNEGISRGIHNVGDIMADCVRVFGPEARRKSNVLSELGVESNEFYLATIHRPANADDPTRMAAIVEGLSQLDFPVVFPIHPRTRAAILRHGLTERLEQMTKRPSDARVMIIEPLGYLDMLQLQQHARVVLTDSGGIQKEVYFLATPCVTIREETEWTETIDTGWNRLCKACPQAIIAAVNHYELGPRPPRPVLYGDGYSAARIVRCLASELGES